MTEREQGGMCNAHSPIHTVRLQREGEDEREGPNPPLLITLPILLPVSSCASSCTPCMPPPMPPHSLLPLPRWLLTALICQHCTGTYMPALHRHLFVKGRRQCWRWVALASLIGQAFGVAVTGLGVSTGFRTSKVVVLRFLTEFGALKLVGVRFSMGFRVSKLVGVQIWGCSGCSSLVPGFQQLLQGGGWQFDGFWQHLHADVARLWVEMEVEGRLHWFRGYRLEWGSDMASERGGECMSGGQVVGNSAGSRWGLPSHVYKQGVTVATACTI